MPSRAKDKKPDFGSAGRVIVAGTPVFRFRIELPLEDEERNVLVWRTIEVPQNYSFWDLHVAIQDAMGWADYHLHEFIVSSNERGQGTLKLGNAGFGDYPALEHSFRCSSPACRCLRRGSDSSAKPAADAGSHSPP